jgi:UTP--glucose-1-phosphate uridylyltransferase
VKRVKKAVIPAAGLGTRFLPATKAIPKEMFPILDKPVIQYIIEEAVEAGIEDILIVTGGNKLAIEKHFSRNHDLEKRLRQENKTALLDTIVSLPHIANIRFVTQKQPLGLGHAISCARPFVGDEPFAVLLGDMISDGCCSGIQPLLKVYNDKQSTVIAVNTVPWSELDRYGVVDGVFVDERLMAVSRLVEKPKENPPSNYAITGRYVLEPNIFMILENLAAGSGGEIQLTDALQLLVRHEPIYACLSDGTVHDVGDKLGYLQATVQKALRHPEFQEPFRSFIKQIVATIDT